VGTRGRNWVLCPPTQSLGSGSPYEEPKSLREGPLGSYNVGWIPEHFQQPSDSPKCLCFRMFQRSHSQAEANATRSTTNTTNYNFNSGVPTQQTVRQSGFRPRQKLGLNSLLSRGLPAVRAGESRSVSIPWSVSIQDPAVRKGGEQSAQERQPDAPMRSVLPSCS